MKPILESSSNRALDNVPEEGRDDHVALENNIESSSSSSSASSLIESSMPGLSDHKASPATLTEEDDEDDSDSPQALVRHDDRAVARWRRMVWMVWTTAAVGACVTVYLCTAAAERTSFEQDFDILAQRIQQAFVSESSLRMYQARTVAAAISFAMQHQKQSASRNETTPPSINPLVDLSIPHDDWDRLTQETRFATLNNLVAMVPILTTDHERRLFEQHAASTVSNVPGHSSSGALNGSTSDTTPSDATTSSASNACLFCPPGVAFSNPMQNLQLPNIGSVKCQGVYSAGLSGVIPPDMCSHAISIVMATCVCANDKADQDENETSMNETTSTNTTSWSLSQGLYRIQGGATVNTTSSSSTTTTTDDRKIVPQEWNQAPYAPIWQGISVWSATPPNMYNCWSDPIQARAIQQAMAGPTVAFSTIYTHTADKYTSTFNTLSSEENAVISIYYPIVATVLNDKGESVERVVGMALLEAFLRQYITGALPAQSDKVTIVIENTCDQFWTAWPSLNGETLDRSLSGDHHDTAYNHMGQSTSYYNFEASTATSTSGMHNKTKEELDYCRYRFHVYPSQRLEDDYRTNRPWLYALGTACIFLFSGMVFCFYDWLVQRRQHKVMASATRTNDIVSSLIPKEYRSRLYEQQAQEQALQLQQQQQQQQQHSQYSNRQSLLANKGGSTKRNKTSFAPNSLDGPSAHSVSRNSMNNQATLYGLHHNGLTSKMQMQNFLQNADAFFGPKPVADLFPHATIMFINIVGFSAWSSEREPTQVFRLLETLYQSYDEVAANMKIFKVETIGDSYVAACGLPSPRRDHAATMVRFASLCIKRMRRITRELEKFLGPSTADLEPRCGIHSGAVTAGVLRGAKCRFQLFGDTMNTAAKMETTSVPGRIHVSKETADILRKSGKGAWLEGRRGFDTFWANPRMKSPGSEGTSSEASQEFSEDSSEDALLLSGNVLPKKYKRLVDWNVEVLYELLENLVASRGFSSPRPSESSRLRKLEKMEDRQGIVLDEMTQILEMPDFDANRLRKKASISIPDCVKSQLHEYVSTIASLYRTTSKFHNFEHSSHVLMSAAKMMKRIVTPDSVDYERKHTDAKTRVLEIAKEVHDSTYGIASDSLMLFSIVFSALIHDVDHVGYTNGELCQLGTTASKTYRQRSVAEQNSVDLAWSLLMDERFVDLRNCIYTTEDEIRRFRQLIVNALLAEDIADKELQQLRKNRWKQAFDESGEGDNNLNRRATIVFEYIIQASDVAHCMQHWNVYCKFNARLFEERYCAYLQGVAKDPSAGWYKGVIWFFDNYIIPTAEKLAQCGVFGVSSDEYLTYALQNRKTWESQGEQIVEQMVADCQTKYPSSSSTTAVEV